MMKKIISIGSIVLLYILLISINYRPSKIGYFDEENTYINEYFKIIEELKYEDYLHDEYFTSESENEKDLNLLKSVKKDIKSNKVKSEITILAIKTDDDIVKYAKEYFDNHSKIKGVTKTSEIKNETGDITCEYKNENWYYKIYLRKVKDYIIEIKITYKNQDERLIYLANRHLIHYFNKLG